MKQRTVLSTLPSDSHSWNLVYLQLLLEELGHEVINVGTCVPIDVLIKKCHESRPNNLVISSVNGHGHLDGMKMILAMKKYPMLKGIRVVIGGKLGTQGCDSKDYAEKLLRAGFDAVFSEKEIPEFISLMNEDTKNNNQKIAL
ncbi:MAG: cobalamin-dependent protein [Gammaproteobacteria bacterium]|nr:cobalamin-dependent protein [Gammaproteobacteria bacterium]